MQRLAGIVQVQVDGEVHLAKGSFSYNPGLPKREAIVGSDTVHGYKETPQVPYIEGEFTDSASHDLIKTLSIKDATVSLNLANGKMFVLHGAYYAGDGTVSTDEANLGVRFEGSYGEEVS